MPPRNSAVRAVSWMTKSHQLDVSRVGMIVAAVPAIRLFEFCCLWKASLLRGANFPLETTRSERRREPRRFTAAQLMAHQSPSPSTGPMVVPKGVQAGVHFAA